MPTAKQPDRGFSFLPPEVRKKLAGSANEGLVKLIVDMPDQSAQVIYELLATDRAAEVERALAVISAKNPMFVVAILTDLGNSARLMEANFGFSKEQTDLFVIQVVSLLNEQPFAFAVMLEELIHSIDIRVASYRLLQHKAAQAARESNETMPGPTPTQKRWGSR